MIIELNLPSYGMEIAAQKGSGLRWEPGVYGEVMRGGFPVLNYGGQYSAFER